MVALADKSMKLRILIIYMFLFYSCRRLPREFLFQKGIFFRGMTRVSKFFVTQCNVVSLKEVKDSGYLSKNVRQVKMFPFFKPITICFMRNESILKNSYQH